MKGSKNIWLYGIIAAFIVFAGLMTTFAVIASRTKVDLVINDYYSAELAYQKQINKINNTNRLTKKPSFNYDSAHSVVTVVFPPEILKRGYHDGTISFYRADNPQKDFSMQALLSGNGSINIPVGELTKGPWKVKMDWCLGAAEYYLEQKLKI